MKSIYIVSVFNYNNPKEDPVYILGAFSREELAISAGKCFEEHNAGKGYFIEKFEIDHYKWR